MVVPEGPDAHRDQCGERKAFTCRFHAWSYSPEGELVGESEPLQVLRGHEGSVHTAAFSAAGTKVMTASEDGTARLWMFAADDLIRLAAERLAHYPDTDRRRAERVSASLLGQEVTSPADPAGR